MTNFVNGIWVFVDNEGPCTIGDNAFENMEEVSDFFGQAVIDYYTVPREAKCGGLLVAITPEKVV